MIKAPIPPMEQQRLAALKAYRILDTPPDAAFDDLTHLAAELCGVPIAMVSLVDDERQWFKARTGVDVRQAPRDISFCGHTICQDGLFVVEDAARDERFHDNPLVVGDPGVRFYAAVPLVSACGHALGALCVVDRKPGRLSVFAAQQLTVLGRQTSRMLELHRMLVHAEQEALRDPLTDLPNRRGLLRRLEQMLARSRSDQSLRVAVAYLDLDRFKPINDSFGHEAGDAVLSSVARRIEGVVQTVARTQRLHDTCVARLGGDEFVAALCGPVQEQWLVQTLAPWLVCAVTQPVQWQGSQLACGASVGFAVAEGRGETGEQLLEHADIAMYRAKREGGRRGRVFCDRMKRELVEQMQLESDLREAIVSQQVGVRYQPVLDLRDRSVVGFEAVAHWRHPRRGRIAPAMLLETAERAGLMVPLFDTLLAQALDALKAPPPCPSPEKGEDEAQDVLPRADRPREGLMPEGSHLQGSCPEGSASDDSDLEGPRQPSPQGTAKWDGQADGQAAARCRRPWLSLNLSTQLLEQPGFAAALMGRLAAAGVDAGAIKLELPERGLDDNDALLEPLTSLRDHGFDLILDGFGAGAASLSTLQRYPLAWLKLTPAYLHDAARDREVATITQAMARLADNLGLEIIADGVEWAEQIALLQAMDIHHAQGPAIGPPQAHPAGLGRSTDPGRGQRAA